MFRAKVCVSYASWYITQSIIGFGRYLALEIASCSTLLLAASLLPVEPVLSLCSLADTSFLRRQRPPILFSEIGVCMASCSYIIMYV